MQHEMTCFLFFVCVIFKTKKYINKNQKFDRNIFNLKQNIHWPRYTVLPQHVFPKQFSENSSEAAPHTLVSLNIVANFDSRWRKLWCDLTSTSSRNILRCNPFYGLHFHIGLVL